MRRAALTCRWPSKRPSIIMAAATLAAAGAAMAAPYGQWSIPSSAEALPGSSSDLNTTSVDGCPILNPYDGSLFMASNRPGGYGGLDIWIAPKSGAGWGTPVNAGPSINTAADEFCPTPARGNQFFFVRRVGPGNTDIFATRSLPGGFSMPMPLSGAINSPFEEWSPSWFQTADGREFLYFSSTRNHAPVAPPGVTPQDIFYSVNYGPPQPAVGDVNSPASDARPNVRRDGREIVWDSTRPGGLGATDIWSSTRLSVDAPWGPAVWLGNNINSPAPESRASLSWDGRRLMFGTGRPGVEGATDMWTATR